MAKTKTAAKQTNRSDVIREILKKNPKANVKTVQQKLSDRGVKASNALINKIKYGRGANGKSPKGRKGNGGVNKADAIRGAWAEIGIDGRPRDVIALLAGRGITVTSAQVSTLRKSVATKGEGIVAISSGEIPFEHLVAAKSLAEKVGGIEKARHALAGLSRLMNA